jgi:transposase
MKVGSTRRRFTDEYKNQAVAFVIEGNRSIADVAKNIGVHEMTLGKWVKKVRESQNNQIAPDTELSEHERAELIRLRAESKNDKATIAELQMQVEFAKKVATWFASGKQ